MFRISGFFLLGAVVLHVLPRLPGSWAFAPLGVAVCLSVRSRKIWFAAAVAGFCWAWLHAEFSLADRLAPHLAGADLEVTGWISSIPRSSGGAVSFLFDVETREPAIPERIRVSWYDAPRVPAAGERWRLLVRLKPPRGFSNPGGFDYEGWLFRHGIGATGYVRPAQSNQRLSPGSWRYAVLRLRAGLNERLSELLGASPMAGIVTALAVGERGQMDAEQWSVLRMTGTNHLMAISGLHIGLAAALGIFLTRGLWSLSPWLMNRCTAVDLGMAGGMLLGGCYALLAGLSVPTQRALIMLSVMASIVWSRRHVPPHNSLAVALFVVLVFDPFAPLATGFWMSFAAVAAILWAIQGRPRPSRRTTELLRVQFAVCLGLSPFVVAFFGGVSLVAPLVNLIVVPIFSLLVIPAILLSIILLFVLPSVGEFLLTWVGHSLQGIWIGLDAVAGWRLAHLDLNVPLPLTLLALPGCALLLAPRGFPGRLLGLGFLVPMLLWRQEPIAQGAYELTVLDVGQGLAAVIRTRSHVLVYDTGPSFRSGTDTGALVVVPHLLHHGIRHVDRLVLSHGDDDHSGGAASLLSTYPATPVTGSDSAAAKLPGLEPCKAGQTWDWDGVEFRILHPGSDRDWSGNNDSCVLMVRTAAGSVLLAGDIEAPVEAHAVDALSDLRADVIVAPHHGSATSSTRDFVAAVGPSFVIFSTGFRNRWGFPVNEVVERWRDIGAIPISTAHSGAIALQIDPQAGVSMPSSHRVATRRYWNAP